MREPLNPYANMRQVPGFEVTSTDIQDGEPLPAEQFATYAGGLGRSPQLSWSGFPAETQSFAVTCFDPDAPTGSGFWHWAVANLSGETTSLMANAGDPDAAMRSGGELAAFLFRHLDERLPQ